MTSHGIAWFLSRWFHLDRHARGLSSTLIFVGCRIPSCIIRVRILHTSRSHFSPEHGVDAEVAPAKTPKPLSAQS